MTTPAHTTEAYRIAAGDGLADVWWKTGRMTIKARGAETGGNFSQLYCDDPRGTATPLPVHREEDETFFVLDGEVTVLVGGDRIDLGPGDYAFAPRGVEHAYVVRSERAHMLVTISPAGLEELFVELGVPVAGDNQPQEEVLPPIGELVRRFAAYGCDVVGPPPSLEGLAAGRSAA
jgi:quercetin dioxygenase-like cupin family protein